MRHLAFILMLGLQPLCPPARTQTLHGLTIGEPLVPALKHMPRTQNFSQVGDYVAMKWSLSDSVSLSATASPDTGRIVFLEEDWNAATPANDLPLPGFAFGTITLGDIRHRFGSNGIGFASNAETLREGSLIGINCYELQRAPGVLVAFVTRLMTPGSPRRRVPDAIDAGGGVFVSFMIAQKTYLQRIWGDKLLLDPHYRPIVMSGLVAAD